MSIFGPYMISQLLKKHEVIILFMNEENDNRGEFILSFEENIKFIHIFFYQNVVWPSQISSKGA